MKEKKPFLKVDYSKVEMPFIVRKFQKNCECPNLDVSAYIEKDDDGSRTIVNFVFCEDCGKSRILENKI